MGLFRFMGGKSKAAPEAPIGGAVAEPKVQGPEPTVDILPDMLVTTTPAPSAPPPDVPAAPAPVETAVDGASQAALAGGKAREVAIYRQLMESLYDALLIVDGTGHVVAHNSRAAEFFGKTAPELWFLDIKMLIPSMTLPALTKIRTYVETGRFAITQAACVRQDNTTFSAELAVRGIKFMNENDLVFTVRNIERRKVAQRRHELELGAVQHTAAAMGVCEPGGGLRFQNPALLKIWGYESENQLANTNVRDLFDEPELAEALITKPQESGTWSGRLTARHKAGHTFTVAASAAAVRTAGGQVESIVVTFIDLSSLRPPSSGVLRLRKPQAPAEEPVVG